MATFSKTDRGTLAHLRWRSLQRLVTVGLATNEHYYFHVAAVTGPSLLVKLKSDENCHALKAAPDMLSCFVDMFS